jgi:hypothetical protein
MPIPLTYPGVYVEENFKWRSYGHKGRQKNCIRTSRSTSLAARRAEFHSS